MREDFPRLELYNHQTTALVSRLAHGWRTGQFSTLLAGDVGTGKTPFYLVYLRCVRRWYTMQGRPEATRPSLAMVPAQIKLQWRNEALRWSNIRTLGPLAYLVVEGDQPLREKLLSAVPAILEGKLELLIINYELARRKVEQQLLQNLPLLGLIVDEAHRIKTMDALQTRATKSIEYEFMVCGTGTVMTKSPADLWSILHAMSPGESFYRKAYIKYPLPTESCPYNTQGRETYYGYFRKGRGCINCWQYDKGCKDHTPHDPGVPFRYRRASPIWGPYDSFVGRYCKTETVHIGGGRYVKKITGAKNLPELRDRLSPHIVRWKKAEVLDLPDLYFRHVLLDFDPDGRQHRLYEDLRSGLIDQLRSDGYWTPVMLKSRLAQLIYLRRSLSLSPTAFYESIVKRDQQEGDLPIWVRQALTRQGSDNAKASWVVNFLVGNVYTGDAQALVWSQWTTVTREIWSRLRDYHAVTGYATGEVNRRASQEVRDAFNAGELDVVVGSPAISEGINLQGAGRPIGYVVVVDCPWTPKDIIQTIGRLYRAEQQSDVEVIFLGIKDTLDQWMLARVQERQKWLQQVLDGETDSGAVKLFDIRTARQLIDAL